MLGVESRLLATMRDRASMNNAAMRVVSIVYPNVLDVGCFSHTLDIVGEKFKTPVLSQFCTMWLSLFSHSPKTKALWREQAMASYNKTAESMGSSTPIVTNASLVSSETNSR